MAHFINHNGRNIHASAPVVSGSNRGFRYGDGLFETIRLRNHALPLGAWHFERLFHGMRLMEFETPSWMNPNYLEQQIGVLVDKNGHGQEAKIRLMVYRDDGSIREGNNIPQFIIESAMLAPAHPSPFLPGLTVEVYPHARKSPDRFSSLKTNNFLPYTMAAMYAQANKADDCLVLNAFDRICDSSIANVFIISGNTVATPSLQEGCIAGVMRRWLITHLPALGFEIIEKEITIKEAEDAGEMFLTNAVQGVRPVKRFGRKEYLSASTDRIRKYVLNEIA
jgi:branched-chain amino acid aminotransferase